MAEPARKPKIEMPVKGPPLEEKHFEDFNTVVKGMYLAFYNLTNALLWAMILGRVVSVAPFWGNYDLNRTTGGWVKWIQTMALAEIFHSLFGREFFRALRNKDVRGQWDLY